MPVRSLSSSVLPWSAGKFVREALQDWVDRVLENLVKVGYFESYARGDWGVGSELDVVIVVGEATAPCEQRSLDWDMSGLPVPVDLLVYTLEEWSCQGLDRLKNEVVWVGESCNSLLDGGK